MNELVCSSPIASWQLALYRASVCSTLPEAKSVNTLLNFLLAFAISAAVFSPAAPKVESIGPLGESAIADGLKTSLEPAGYRVSLSDGSVACEVWLRKGLSLQAKTDTQGAL